MNKKIIKPVVLSVLFLAALIIFSAVTNRDNKDFTTTMSEATLPIVNCYQKDVSIAKLHGYVSKMDVTAMRDTIIPVDSGRILPIKINTYGNKVEEIRYEIRSINGERLVAKNVVSDIVEKDDMVSADLTIQNILEQEKEYQLILSLKTGKQTVYYYTRLMQTQNSHAKESMDFALQFHDYTFRKDADKFIPRYMDDTTGDMSTLNYVDLHCNLKQITWADLKPEQIGGVDASYKEINASYNVITLRYMIASKNKNKVLEYYNVEEYYRLRMTNTRMYVLNFERTTNQIFKGENRFITDQNKIELGIRDPQIEYAINETGDIIAFVQEGELWCYDRNNNKMVKVFGFRSAEGTDWRDDWDQHDIKIAGVDEAGSIDFVVYGYMNRGNHEGTVGTTVYHYDGIVHTIEEQVFIPSNRSYEVLKAEMGQLLYVNDQGTLYLIMNQALYKIDMNKLKPEVVVDNLKEGCYQISDSNQYFAWVDGDKEYQSPVIQLMNLKNGTIHEIKEGEDESLRPLGFIENDFIYGAAKKTKVLVEKAGNTVFPMSYLKIMDTSEEKYDILKQYTPQRGRIGSISIDDYTISIHLIKKAGGRYQKYKQDAIMNREGDTEQKIAVGTTVTERKERQYQLVMKENAQSKPSTLLTAKEVMLEKPRKVSFEEKDRGERFYVYQKGDVLLSTSDISEAILCANDQLGVVVDSGQQYIWMRAHKSICNAFSGMKVNTADQGASSVVQSVSALLEYQGKGLGVKELLGRGETPKSVIKTNLTDAVALDVSGCTVQEVIFYISEGSPVFAMTGTDSAVLITGYSSSRIYYYDPVSHSTHSKSYKEADDWFAKAGNIFFTYLLREE